MLLCCFSSFKVCFGDVNAAEGEATEKIFQEIYGSDSVLFVKCDVTKDNEFKGFIYIKYLC